MKVRVISSYCKGGGIDLSEGTILTVGVDLTEHEARIKLAQGFVTQVEEPAIEGEADGEIAEPEHPDTGEELVDRDPKPSRGRRRG